jgi:hypothetical protein
MSQEVQDGLILWQIFFLPETVKISIKSVRFCWLTSVDENVKPHHKQFASIYVSAFRKKNTDLILHDIDGTF